jgi:hypothetical protein
LLTPAEFARKLAGNFAVGAMLIGGSLTAGAAGYHFLESIPWLDAFLNAAMILTGMGPVDHVNSDAGKFFAICYSLFSGVVFLSAVAVMLAPIVHRFLHRLHLDLFDSDD